MKYKECKECKRNFDQNLKYHAKGLCINCYNRKWRKNNPDKQREIQIRENNRRKAERKNKEYKECKECKRKFDENLKHYAKDLCKNCYSRIWRKNNPRKKEKKHKECKECKRKFDENLKHHGKGLCNNCYNKKWRKNNPDRSRETQRRANKKRYKTERYKKSSLRAVHKFKENNYERLKEIKRNYSRTEKGKITSRRARNKRRSSLKDPIPKNFILNKLELNDYICGNIYCNEEVGVDSCHLEHSTPVSKSGTNDPQNLDTWCSACNMRKHNKTLEEFYLEEGKKNGFYIF